MKQFFKDDNMETIELDEKESLVLDGPPVIVWTPEQCYVKPDGSFTPTKPFAPSLIFRTKTPFGDIVMEISAKTLAPVVKLLRKMGEEI